MPNYLNKPLSSNFEQTYVSQFVPLPLAQFARANERDQAQQDAQVAQAEAVSDQLWKVNGTTPDDKAYTDGLRGSYDEAAGKLSSMNLTQKENQDAVKDLIKSTSRDPSLNLIMSNAAIAAEHAKLKDEHQKSGTYSAANDMFDSSYMDYAKSGGYKSGKSLDSTIYKYEDGRPVRERMFDDMAKLGVETLGHVRDEWYKDGIEGISESRIGKQAAAAISEYRATPAAAQSAREYAYKVRNTNPKYLTKDGQMKDSKGKAISSEKYVLDEFINAGMERAGLSTTTGRAAALTADAKTRKADAKEAEESRIYSSKGQKVLLGGGFDLDESDFGEDGNFKGSGMSLVDVFKNNLDHTKPPVNYFTSTTFNNQNPKDQRKQLLSAAARVNGYKTDGEYYNKHAAPDMQLATTFYSIPAKRKAILQKEFYDPATGTGVFANATVYNPTTGERGTLIEILRLRSEQGALVDSKGKEVTLSDTPTAEEKQRAMSQVGIKGRNAPNYNSAMSLTIGINNEEWQWDRTNNGQFTDALIKNGELTQQEVDAHRMEKLRTSPEVVKENGEDYLYYINEKPGLDKNGKTMVGRRMKEKLSNIKF